MKDLYVIKEGKKLRCGYTTGSCSAAAAKACVLMLLKGRMISHIEIDTPYGIRLDLEVYKPYIDGVYASCCVIKDGGDDPDVTNGMEIYAKVSKRQDNRITIDGGEGIGRIIRKGLFGEVGEAAINPVPRKMIIDEIRRVSNDGFDVVIYAPEGEEVAKKTFNKNIGIEGGISIIGTSGIVEPMSEKALIKTIYMEIDKIHQETNKEILLFLGNHGEKVVSNMGIEGPNVKISNFIGDALLYCYNKGFKRVTLVGHIGKLAKLSIGCFNTHNKVCDVRMEAFVYYLALKGGVPLEVINKVKNCLTTEEVLKMLFESGWNCILEDMKNGCKERVKRYVKDNAFNFELYMYSMEYGVL